MLGKILVIAGPTASGKTAFGLHLAGASDVEVELVGADSVQVYRGFDIGSAKPDASELQGTPHHLIDVLDPTEFIDAMDYAQLADAAIRGIRSRGALPIVVGGTGLWIRALIRGLVQLPKPDLEIRARLETEAKRDRQALHRRLQRVDPAVAKRVHENDILRVTRALEVWEQTGVPLGEHQRQHQLGEPRYDARLWVLDPEREMLKKRIRARTEAMITAGFQGEVESLLERWPREARAFGSVGYKEMVSHITGELPLADAIDSIVSSTSVYARRQRTWFRKEPGVDRRAASAHDWMSEPDVSEVLQWLKAP